MSEVDASSRAFARLTDPALVRLSAYVNGRWNRDPDATALVVTNPANGEQLCEIGAMSVNAAIVALPGVVESQRKWQALTAFQRASCLRRWYEQADRVREDLAILIVLEQGKPIREARDEVDYALSFLSWFSQEAVRIYGRQIPGAEVNRQLVVSREALGVALLVTPWNFPLGMITRKAGAALAAGCSSLVCPSPHTPLSALALGVLAERAGIPAGVFNVLPGEPADLVPALIAEPSIDAVSFTGSTAVGLSIAADCSKHLKRVSLELGGHAPFIGFADVPVEELVQAALEAKFQTSGQDCMAANRIYIHTECYSRFLEQFSAAVAALAVGDGLDPNTAIGPLQNPGQVSRMREQVADALSKGATLLCGGEALELGDCYFAPTVLADVTPDMRIYREETFGPVAAIIAFSDEKEVLTAANDSDFGLAAYLYCNSSDICQRLSKQLRYGMVAVNCVAMTGAQVPFGGYRYSGLGREGALEGIEAFTEVKLVCTAYQPYQQMCEA